MSGQPENLALQALKSAHVKHTPLLLSLFSTAEACALQLLCREFLAAVSE